MWEGITCGEEQKRSQKTCDVLLPVHAFLALEYALQ